MISFINSIYIDSNTLNSITKSQASLLNPKNDDKPQNEDMFKLKLLEGLGQYEKETRAMLKSNIL